MLPKHLRLRQRRDFGRVYRRGKSVACPGFVLYKKQGNGRLTRFGFSVSKKVGNAVVRNRIKRRFRAVVQERLSLFAAGCDYIFVLRSAALGYSHTELVRQVEKMAAAIGRK